MRASALVSFLLLSSAACRGGQLPAAESHPARPPIVLVTIDTLRADRLGSYGSTRGLTPSLDALAREATRFSAAVSQVPLTLPSHATILTGLHPARHGIRTNDGFRLPSEVPTLAESLKAAGYLTAAFIGGYPLRGSTSGLARGFDRYDDGFLAAADVTERSADAGWVARCGLRPHRLPSVPHQAHGLIGPMSLPHQAHGLIGPMSLPHQAYGPIGPTHPCVASRMPQHHRRIDSHCPPRRDPGRRRTDHDDDDDRHGERRPVGIVDAAGAAARPHDP
jgi:hypothetical protein